MSAAIHPNTAGGNERTSGTGINWIAAATAHLGGAKLDRFRLWSPGLVVNRSQWVLLVHPLGIPIQVRWSDSVNIVLTVLRHRNRELPRRDKNTVGCGV
jgi:hypothetical protein